MSIDVSQDEVINHLRDVDGAGDAEWLSILEEQVRSYPKWTLRDVALTRLSYDVSDDVHGYEKAFHLPIVVVPADGLLEVIDGRHRASRAAELNRKRIKAYVPRGAK